jgi:hypothetical protein
MRNEETKILDTLYNPPHLPPDLAIRHKTSGSQCHAVPCHNHNLFQIQNHDMHQPRLSFPKHPKKGKVLVLHSSYKALHGRSPTAIGQSARPRLPRQRDISLNGQPTHRSEKCTRHTQTGNRSKEAMPLLPSPPPPQALTFAAALEI